MKNISNEMLVTRFGNGIKLLPPESSQLTGCMDMQSQLDLPFNVFFVDTNNALVKVNESTALSCGFDSPESAPGLLAKDFADKDSADFAVRCDNHVMTNNLIHNVESELIRNDGIIKHFLTIRMPWYDTNDRVCGLFGYAVSVGEHSLVSALEHFSRMDLLNAGRLNKTNIFNFSRREMQCAMYLLRGKTLRDIAGMMELSVRTVESYLVNMKFKAGVSKKSELVELLYTHFYEQ